MTQGLTERYADRIGGVLSCYDRLVITGTLPMVCYAEGMTRYLNTRGIRIFDYPDFAKTLRERVRETAAALAAENGVAIEHVGKPHIRKEDIIARVLAQRGEAPGLVHVMDRYATLCCPVAEVFGQDYHWSLMQVEYATDLAFRSTATLGPLYEQLVRQSVLDVKAEHVASFLGRQITPLLAQEIGSQFATRIEGTCIKHRFGKCSIKMYDKHGIVLRIETTSNDVSFFKHHRKVEHPQGPPTRDVAPVKKTIYSLIDLREILLGCNRRYLAHLSALDDLSAGVRSLGPLPGAAHQAAGDRRPQREGAQLLRPGRAGPAARHPGPEGQYRRLPPRRPSGRTGDVLADTPVAATAPVARYRGDQARHRHLPLLSDQSRPCCHSCRGTADRGHYHSGIDLMGFLLRVRFNAECAKSSGIRD
jgi:hypothetical protein